MANYKAIPQGYMTVGEVAKKMSVTVRALQYYDREGLFCPSAVSEGGRRLYTDKDIIKLHQILSLKSLGFSIDEIKNRLPSDEVLCDLAELYKMFGDSTRTKILSCLQNRACFVNELAEVLGMSVSAVSHQLRILRGAKLVRGNKQGKEVLYSLDDDHVTKILECGLTHVNEPR